ncbi:PREDICTED: anoctamin-1-like [Cyprinodon variegatus]|uniref:anoctamin-1-like n=1 Tax=Cyprinodon variegatus TaxID=28743 RepID=UPI000742A93C|nr:PREDICTED: anoctamin-1-like [Cyprinodon variegatus]
MEQPAEPQPDSRQEMGSPPVLHCESRESSLQEEGTTMRRGEHYLPVPGEDKNLDRDRNNHAGNNESMPMKSLDVNDGSLLHAPLGPYFSDGQRRVDYVLTYSVQKPNGVRRPSSKPSEGNMFERLRRSMSTRSSKAPLQPREDPEVAATEQQDNYHEDDKRFKRDEFEQNLQEIGLELEKDESSKFPGIGFLKIHAPWTVLCREAEIMKLKMPTKKVYEVKPSSNIVEKIRRFIHKVTDPLHPKVGPKRREDEKSLSLPFSREKQHLFDLSDRDQFFDTKTRSYIVSEVLKRIKCTRPNYSMGITSLLANGVYTSGYPLHDGDIEGANAEPNDRKHEENLWLDVETGLSLRLPPKLLRRLLLGGQTASLLLRLKQESINSRWTDKQQLLNRDVSLHRKYFGEKVGLYFAWLGVYTQMLIPAAIVGVIVFLYGCATVDDNIPSCDPQEEHKDHHRAEYELRVAEKTMRQDHGAPKEEKVKLTCTDRMPAYATTVVMMAFMIAVTLAIVFGVILYRITIKTALHLSTFPAARSNVRATVKTTAAIMSVIIIIILDEIYASVARWLTRMEVPKTDKSYEERLIFKTFVLKFVNAFSPIVYLAFFRGRLVGRPGNYLYVVGTYRMEECAHAGCLMELCIQLCITMLGKQLIQNNLFEIGIPKIKKLMRKRKSAMTSKQEEDFNKTLKRYEKDNILGPFVSINPEYMEMIIQFGMVTLFVASFPLAPLFALLNNIIEIRLDAKKFVMELRRPIAAKAKDIGIWYNLLRGLSKVAVIVNAFVIAFTSDFIPRLVYQYQYSRDGTMHGFVNHTLSYFNVNDFEPGTAPQQPDHLGYEVKICRYKDYRDPPWSDTAYSLSKEFWCILAIRLAFVIIFQNVVMLMSDFVDWLIPDIPKDISLQIHKEKLLMLEHFMKEEKGKRLTVRGNGNHDNCTSPSSDNPSPPQPRSRPVFHARAGW